MFKNIFPNKILSLKYETINIFVILLLLILALGLSYALFLSPPDYIQGDSVRIMYVHVPASFLALGCFSFLGMIKKSCHSVSISGGTLPTLCMSQ